MWITVKQDILELLRRRADWVSIPDLTRSTGANYNTVRGAVGWLIRDGILESRNGLEVTKRGQHKVTLVKLKC